jgi:hypothetical protein
MTRFVRIWLPVAVVAAGLVAIAINPTADGVEGAAHIIGAGLAIWLMNFLFRIGISGDRDRDAEDAARDYFDAHGYWPDEAPPEAPAPPEHRSAAPHPHRARPIPRHRGGR